MSSGKTFSIHRTAENYHIQWPSKEKVLMCGIVAGGEKKTEQNVNTTN